MTSAYYSPQIGDVTLHKGRGIVQRLIQLSYHRASPLKWKDDMPSNHNGIVGIHENRYCVFQAQTSGFVAVPLDDEIKDATLSRQELKIARLPGGLPNDRRLIMNTWLINHLGTEYDFWSYVSHIWRSVLRLTPIVKIECEREFYCSEAAYMAYRFIGQDWIKNDLPTPYTIEKRIEAGKAEIVAEFS